MEDMRQLDISNIQIKVKLWYRSLLLPFLIIVITIDIYFIKSGYEGGYLLLGLLLGSDFISNYIILNFIQCLYCKQRYFSPRFCGKEELSLLLSSNHTCVSCGKRMHFFFRE